MTIAKLENLINQNPRKVTVLLIISVDIHILIFFFAFRALNLSAFSYGAQ